MLKNGCTIIFFSLFSFFLIRILLDLFLNCDGKEYHHYFVDIPLIKFVWINKDRFLRYD